MLTPYLSRSMHFVREEKGWIGIPVRPPFKFLVQPLLRGGATCHRGWLIPSLSLSLPLFFLSTPSPLPFSFLFFRHIGAIYGLVQEGGEIEERVGGGGSDKSLVVKRGDHGGEERRRGEGGQVGEGVQSFARRGFQSWNRIYIFRWWGGNSWDSTIWMEFSST